MDIGRFRKIIEYSDYNRDLIESKINRFYSFIGLSSDKQLLNIMQIARDAFNKKGYLVLEIPFADDEIGALCYKDDGLGYVVLNTSLPKVNVNFAICHELYHAFYGDNYPKTRVEFSNNHYHEDDNEFAANLFAGMILMPEDSFRLMYAKFNKESSGNEIYTLFRLMNYYQVPYMAALIRCHELQLSKNDGVSEEILNIDSDKIREGFKELWLDDNILNATKKDDYSHLEIVVERLGNEYIKDEYINERTLEKILKNMRTIYESIKEE